MPRHKGIPNRINYTQAIKRLWSRGHSPQSIQRILERRGYFSNPQFLGGKTPEAILSFIQLRCAEFSANKESGLSTDASEYVRECNGSDSGERVESCGMAGQDSRRNDEERQRRIGAARLYPGTEKLQRRATLIPPKNPQTIMLSPTSTGDSIGEADSRRRDSARTKFHSTLERKLFQSLSRHQEGDKQRLETMGKRKPLRKSSDDLVDRFMRLAETPRKAGMK